ncbi:MAG: hypothetical protein ACJ74U_17120 [Jatrophihabitantaceae bacterium]
MVGAAAGRDESVADCATLLSTGVRLAAGGLGAWQAVVTVTAHNAATAQPERFTRLR